MEKLKAIFERMGITGVHDIAPADYPDIVSASRAAVWKRACDLGQCRYADPPRNGTDEPRAVDSTNTCGGYLGVWHPEEKLWRWRICDRQRRWAHERAKLVRDERDRYDTKKKDGSRKTRMDEE